jgi:hypothetical protein
MAPPLDASRQGWQNLAVRVTGGVCLLALLTLAPAAWAQGNGTPLIGRAVAAETGAALPRVRIAALVNGAPVDPVFVDDQGWFAVDAPAQASVTFTASKAGYVELRRTVALDERSRIAPLEVRMRRAGALAGRVTNASGGPTARATVVARLVASTSPAVPDSRSAHITTTTDERGEYRFGGLLPGRYEVTLDEAASGRSLMVDVQAEFEIGGVNLGGPATGPGVVSPSASLAGGGFTGTVIDEFGDPVQGVRVDALRVEVVNGRIEASSKGSARTDDRGQYRIAGLMSGRYLARVSTEAFVSGGPQAGELGFAPIYYPGVVSVGWADPVDVRQGREEAAVDAVFSPSLAVRVSGRAVDAAGRPLSGSARLVTSRDQTLSLDLPAVPVRPDGSFVIRNVPPGSYVVQVDATAAGGRPAMTGTAEVSVFDRDPPPVTVTALR